MLIDTQLKKNTEITRYVFFHFNFTEKRLLLISDFYNIIFFKDIIIKTAYQTFYKLIKFSNINISINNISKRKIIIIIISKSFINNYIKKIAC